MNMIELLKHNRSYRRFDEKQRLTTEQLKGWVDLTRYCASGSNIQPLKFFTSVDEATNALIFSTLSWAGALKDWNGPVVGERPAGYIIILGDKEISKNFGVDHGIAAQSILLAATADGYGGCMLASIKREALQSHLQLDERYEILLVLALGKPVEIVKLTEIPDNGSTKYWRDDEGIHYVPKRALEGILIAQDKG
jgi:nitroreductase